MNRLLHTVRMARLAQLLSVFCVLATLGISAAPADASHGGNGGGGGGTTTPTVPPIQLAPDSSTFASGATQTVQVVVNPASPAGGETLTVTSSSSSVSVPATVFVPAGFNAQFQITANPVTVSTQATVTVSLGAASASLAFTVTPPVSPSIALSSIDAFPRVVAGGDAVTVSTGLSSSAPPGGLTVSLHSDSTLLVVPATVTIAAGATLSQVVVTASAVMTPAIVHLTASVPGKSVTGQLEIDSARTLPGLAVSQDPTDASQTTTGGVSISVPADGPTPGVALRSSNPAVASVPAQTGFGDQQSTASFPITVASVAVTTTVTISATFNGATLTTTLTVAPVPPPSFAVQLVTVSQATVAGNATISGTVTTTTGAPPGGATIQLSSSDTKLGTVPATVLIPAGATSATFPIKVTGTSNADISIGAIFHNLGHAAPLGVTKTGGGTLIPAFTTNQVLETHRLNDTALDTLGFYSGGVASVESGQLPPGISLISNLRPGEFVFHGSPQRAGTYTFVLKFEGAGTGSPYALAYVWVITPN